MQHIQKISFDPQMMSFFSTLLSYPRDNYHEVAKQCFQRIDHDSDFSVFFEFLKSLELDEIQSYYTEMFELNFHISPYVGYYLFGESYLRSSFLVELKSRYRMHGYIPKNELPDHFSVIFDFISKHPETSLAEELIQSAVIPALKRIIWTKVRQEDMPQSISAGLAFYSLFVAIYNYLNKSEDKLGFSETITLPVHSSPIPDNSGIDQWIRKAKKKEVK